ncbi:hypothetical protein CUJ84_Chr002186 [Rhizobium leguminosarum]|uniref:Uncharacterized protein n=1 Tax=Rhizobium leguminosarum TaxID=384 RepID=A0A2K9Z2Y9_RHILE|nr:hypothetical protein CUJ84_Chr002186 [Rhizobium leguminosarum]
MAPNQGSSNRWPDLAAQADDFFSDMMLTRLKPEARIHAYPTTLHRVRNCHRRSRLPDTESSYSTSQRRPRSSARSSSS